MKGLVAAVSLLPLPVLFPVFRAVSAAFHALGTRRRVVEAEHPQRERPLDTAERDRYKAVPCTMQQWSK